MIQTIKNFLKRFLPPPVHAFNREMDELKRFIAEQDKQQSEKQAHLLKQLEGITVLQKQQLEQFEALKAEQRQQAEQIADLVKKDDKVEEEDFE